MLLHFDFSGNVPLYLQLRNQIVIGIAQGRLSPGEKLPTVRALAEDSGINMMTVSKAYQLLKQEGYLRTDRRAGTVVCVRVPSPSLPEQTRAALELALAEAKTAGTPLEEILELCRTLYDNP